MKQIYKAKMEEDSECTQLKGAGLSLSREELLRFAKTKESDLVVEMSLFIAGYKYNNSPNIKLFDYCFEEIFKIIEEWRWADEIGVFFIEIGEFKISCSELKTLKEAIKALVFLRTVGNYGFLEEA